MNCYPQNCSTPEGRKREDRKSRNLYDDDNNDDYDNCKDKCVNKKCYKDNGNKKNDFKDCKKKCKKKCNDEDEADEAFSLFANGGAESKKCLDECTAAQMA